MKVAQTNSGISEGVAVALPEEGNKKKRGIIGNFKYFFNSFYLKNIQSTIQSNPASKRQAMFLALALAAVIFPHLVHAEDLLASQKANANDTFGHGSTVEWYLYVGEILVSVFAYIKSRNPMVFGGLLIVMLATRSLFAIIG